MQRSARFSPPRADVEQTLTTRRLLCTGTVFAMAEVTPSVGYRDARPARCGVRPERSGSGAPGIDRDLHKRSGFHEVLVGRR
jgi:hypothetical protein